MDCVRYRSWIRLFSSADNTIAPIRRNQVQGHDALHLLRKVRIARQPEGLQTMRLQPAGSPELVNGRSRKSRRPAHRAQAPVGGVRRSPVKGHANQLGHPVRGDAARATRSRSMVERGHATLKKTLPPLARRMSRDHQGFPDLVVPPAMRRLRGDPGPNCQVWASRTLAGEIASGSEPRCPGFRHRSRKDRRIPTIQETTRAGRP